jgi:small GTP-binding protein
MALLFSKQSSIPEDVDITIKACMIGDSYAGKTCLLYRLTDDKFIEQDSTIGVDFCCKTFDVKNRHIKMQIWDTAGLENFDSICRNYYRGAAVIFIAVDLSDPANSNRFKFIEKINKWLYKIRESATESVKICIIGTKQDSLNPMQLESITDLNTRYFLNQEMNYFSTSSRTGIGVFEAFNKIAHEIYDELKSAYVSNGYSLQTKSFTNPVNTNDTNNIIENNSTMESFEIQRPSFQLAKMTNGPYIGQFSNGQQSYSIYDKNKYVIGQGITCRTECFERKRSKSDEWTIGQTSRVCECAIL